MTKFVLIACAVGAVAALAWAMGWIREETERTDWLGLQRVDADFPSYRMVRFAWALTRSGIADSGTHEAFIKLYDASDHLGLCGYMVMRHGGQSLNAARWLAEARINVGGHKFRASFINAATPGFTPADAQAGCVVSRVRWAAPFADAAATLSGPAVSLTK